MTLRWLSNEDVTACVDMRDVIDAVAGAYIAYSSGESVTPVRSALELPGGGLTLTMPASLPGEGTTAVKVVSVYPNNASTGLPTVLGLVMVLDARTGEPQALMEAGYLTGLRTGAASGVATDALARRDASTLAVIGTGFQARFQAEAVAVVRRIRSVWVYSRDARRRGAFATDLEAYLHARGYPAEVRAAGGASEAVRDADIICAATTSAVPVFDAADVQPGAHINGVGSYTLEMQEVPVGVVRRARVVVDSREAAEVEAGDLLPAVQAGDLRWGDLAEIGEVLAAHRGGRESPDEITFFKSVGLGVQDAAAAGLVVRRASEHGIGVQLSG